MPCKTIIDTEYKHNQFSQAGLTPVILNLRNDSVKGSCHSSRWERKTTWLSDEAESPNEREEEDKWRRQGLAGKWGEPLFPLNVMPLSCRSHLRVSDICTAVLPTTRNVCRLVVAQPAASHKPKYSCTWSPYLPRCAHVDGLAGDPDSNKRQQDQRGGQQGE